MTKMFRGWILLALLGGRARVRPTDCLYDPWLGQRSGWRRPWPMPS